MSVSGSVTRPTSVTVAVAIGWISVILDVAAGIGLLVLANNESALSALSTDAGTARALGIASLVFAAILAVVVYLLGQGSGGARMLVSIVMVLRIAAAIWAIIAFGSHTMSEAIVTIIIAVFALALLWNESASSYFASRS